MPVYLVTYDLKQPERKYQYLYNAIDALGDSVCKLMDSTLFIYCPQDAVDLYNYLNRFTDDDDILFVGQITDEYAEKNMSDKAKKWLDGSFTLP